MESNLEQLSNRFMEAVRDRELIWLDDHLALEFTLTTGRPEAPVRTRDEWLAITAERYTIEEFTFEELRVRDYGHVGVVRSRYRQRASMDGESRNQTYLMTDIWVETGGTPQLVTRHISPLAGPS